MPYRYPKSDHYHVCQTGPHEPRPKIYMTQRAALAECPDGFRVEGCLATLARCANNDPCPWCAQSPAAPCPRHDADDDPGGYIAEAKRDDAADDAGRYPGYVS
jgi:hypothetical protein